ncbi:unnamed protein product, partial [Arabidopsis halleri]
KIPKFSPLSLSYPLHIAWPQPPPSSAVDIHQQILNPPPDVHLHYPISVIRYR